MHGSGESRRLPAYAAPGKPLIPIPVFESITGQRPDQRLVDLQVGEQVELDGAADRVPHHGIQDIGEEAGISLHRALDALRHRLLQRLGRKKEPPPEEPAPQAEADKLTPRRQAFPFAP